MSDDRTSDVTVESAYPYSTKELIHDVSRYVGRDVTLADIAAVINALDRLGALK